jgi:hypothetical protein
MANQLLTTLRNPVKFKLFLLKKLPMGFLAGLHLKEIYEERSEVQIKYKYLTQNPFRSLYFACLAMAGEMASGVLSILHVSNSSKPVSMLVVHMDADFTKKAIGKIVFKCDDGMNIKDAIDQTIRTGEGTKVIATSTGYDEAGDKVAVFRITWSFKAKKI